MRILHIVDSLGLGGAQSVLKGIFEAQKENEEIFLIALRKRKINVKIDHPNVIVNKSDKKYSFSPLKDIKKLIRKENTNIIHCHLFRSQIFGFILKSLYFPYIKLIFHEHGEVFQNHKIYNFFMKISKKKVDLYLAVSKATKYVLFNKIKIPENKIQILYNFVDLEKFDVKKINLDINNERQKLKINTDEFIIGFVGRLCKIKGCEYLIKSLPYLNFNYKCLIAGDGPDLTNLKKLSKILGLEEKIVFLGYINNIHEYYPLINALVIPSSSEASPMAFYEAQAFGIPVIGSDVPALNEFIIKGKNGFLFEYGNYNDLARILNSINCNKTILKSMYEFSKENIQKYSLDNYLKQLNEIYNKMLLYPNVVT